MGKPIIPAISYTKVHMLLNGSQLSALIAQLSRSRGDPSGPLD